MYGESKETLLELLEDYLYSTDETNQVVDNDWCTVYFIGFEMEVVWK